MFLIWVGQEPYTVCRGIQLVILYCLDAKSGFIARILRCYTFIPIISHEDSVTEPFRLKTKWQQQTVRPNHHIRSKTINEKVASYPAYRDHNRLKLLCYLKNHFSNGHLPLALAGFRRQVLLFHRFYFVFAYYSCISLSFPFRTPIPCSPPFLCPAVHS